MPPAPQPSAPSLVDSLDEYLEDLPADARVDGLHGVFYGFYARVAIIDRATHELAERAKEDAKRLPGLPAPMAEALRDNALFVGQELFASRVRAMRAMGYVSQRLAELLDGSPPARPFTLQRAIAFDQKQGRMRSYRLSHPGEHPDLPYGAPADRAGRRRRRPAGVLADPRRRLRPGRGPDARLRPAHARRAPRPAVRPARLRPAPGLTARPAAGRRAGLSL